MVKLYVKKITGKEINHMTGQEWELEDVPELWYDEVEEELEN